MEDRNTVQTDLFNQPDAPVHPVTCLGLTFANDEERRAYFTERLREYLQDPDFRSIEGFPIGEDEDILALSDPPYYTACPNPFLPQIIDEWNVGRIGNPSAAGRNTIPSHEDHREPFASDVGRIGNPSTAGRNTIPSHEDHREPFAPDVGRIGNPSAAGRNTIPSYEYHREPFASDVSEGKTDRIYQAHAYHTKVPHKAIMRYILHYTDPGDIIFDGFCGTGMTGVAAQLCGDHSAVTDLGYRVDKDGNIYEGNEQIARLGIRKAILNDLSPAATFIAYNYNTPVDVNAFEREAKRILQELEDEWGWMYETLHTDGKTKCRINYTVWSEVFTCPNCAGEIVFAEEALDETMRVQDEFPCPHCGAALDKRSLERDFETLYDPFLRQTHQRIRFIPYLAEYTLNGNKLQKLTEKQDRQLLSEIGELDTPATFPAHAFPIDKMYHGSRLAPKGFTHIHHLFLPRARQILNVLWDQGKSVQISRIRSMLLFTFEQAIWGMSLLNRYSPTHYSQVNRYLNGVYYVASQSSEVSPWYILEGKLSRLVSAFTSLKTKVGATATSTQSTTTLSLPPNSVDYIFTDPPFGENIYYADLNYLVESWHKVLTQSQPEAIIDRAKGKNLYHYQELMRTCFQRYYEALKPGRWMTVEFHNSHNAVWRAIQEALISAGFVVADTRTLDKKQSSYRQVTAGSAAKQDLIISAYKPTTGFEQRFLSHAGTTDGVWEFVRQHLAQVPTVVRGSSGHLEIIAERQNYLLFDRMVAYHIQRGVAVPMGAAQFYAGLRQHFVERDDMVFLPDQVAEYDKARLEAPGLEQLSLFVNDEKSALTWLRQQLNQVPQTCPALKKGNR